MKGRRADNIKLLTHVPNDQDLGYPQVRTVLQRSRLHRHTHKKFSRCPPKNVNEVCSMRPPVVSNHWQQSPATSWKAQLFYPKRMFAVDEMGSTERI